MSSKTASLSATLACLLPLVLLGACSDDIPPLKFDFGDGGGYPRKDQGPDFPPPPTLNKCDVVITELMAAPANKDVEWIEIQNNTAKEQDLSGALITLWHKDKTKADKIALGKDAKTKVAAGGRLVVCSCVSGSTASATLGCYNPPACKSISMVNTPDATTGYTVQFSAGSTVLHTVVYGKTGGPPKPKTGASLRLAGELTAATMCAESAKAAAWCSEPEDKTYDTAKANAGTPGAANTGCCFFKPRAGDLRINEAMPDAPGEEDQNEWVELFVAAGPGPNGEVDLYDTRLIYGTKGTDSTALSMPDGSEGCMRVKKGDYVLLTHKKKSTADACTQTGKFSIGAVSLTNKTGYLGLLDADKKEIVTKFQYDNSKETTSVEGRAYSYDATAKKWCWLSQAAASKYCSVTSGTSTDEGYGTPGKANVSCP